MLYSYTKNSKVYLLSSYFLNLFLDSVYRQGERVRGPHVIECNANINRVKIRQYVHFPNGHEQDFVVESTTKASELVVTICRELKFHSDSATGLSLYLETGKKRKII
jgi:hypothetical protein